MQRYPRALGPNEKWVCDNLGFYHGFTSCVAEIFVKNLSAPTIQDPEVAFELGANIDTV